MKDEPPAASPQVHLLNNPAPGQHVCSQFTLRKAPPLAIEPAPPLLVSTSSASRGKDPSSHLIFPGVVFQSENMLTL